MLKGLILSVALILVWALSLLSALQFAAPRRVYKTMVICFAPIVPAYLLLYVLTPASFGFLPAQLAEVGFALGLMDGLIVLVLLFCTGVLFYFHVARSITLRLLLEFGLSPDAVLSIEAIERAYGVHQIIEHRIEAMAANGYLSATSGRYHVTVKGRFVSLLAQLVRKLVHFNFRPIS